MLCYHFCSRKFLQELKNKKLIIPNKKHLERDNNRINAYNYLFNKLHVNSLFFAWYDKDNKDSDIEYVAKSDIVLLTLDVPKEQCILTDYYNWCDVIFCLDGNNTMEDAKKIALEEMKCTFDIVYNSIFDVSNPNRNRQVLLKSINYNWIKNIEYVKKKII